MSLKLANVSHYVPDGENQLCVLEDVSLEVARGDVVVLTGESGSGKSTLLSIAGLLKKPSSGDVRIGDIEATKLSKKRQSIIRRHEIGFIFQSSNLFPSLTTLEQLEIVAHIDGRLNRDIKKKAKELLESLGIAHRMHHRPNQLSGGEKQRVAIGRALMNQPSVILADEPTASLDAQRGKEIIEILSAQSKENDCATLIVTHNVEQIPDGATRLKIAHGKLVG